MNDVVDQASLVEDLSDADKDTLIARLWRDLQEERARSQELERRLALGTNDPAPNFHSSSPLLARLQQAGAAKRPPRQPQARRRAGFGPRFAVLRSNWLIATAVIVTLAFAVDFAVGRYQEYRVEQKRLADLRLQHAAFEGMYVEVVKVAYELDEKSYRLTMKFSNDEPGRPLYIMLIPRLGDHDR